MKEATEDKHARRVVSRLTAVVSSGIDDGRDIAEGLEACLWTFLHLGQQSSHVLKLADSEAMEVFASTGEGSVRDKALGAVMSLEDRFRHHIADVAGHYGVLTSHDMKHFIQRFVLIKVPPLPHASCLQLNPLFP
jgi:hypothetical protein